MFDLKSLLPFNEVFLCSPSSLHRHVCLCAFSHFERLSVLCHVDKEKMSWEMLQLKGLKEDNFAKCQANRKDEGPLGLGRE